MSFDLRDFGAPCGVVNRQQRGDGGIVDVEASKVEIGCARNPANGGVVGAGGAFTALPGAVYDLNTRTAGSTTNAITRTAVSFVAGKVYTIGARGDITVVSTTLATRPQLDNTANR